MVRVCIKAMRKKFNKSKSCLLALLLLGFNFELAAGIVSDNLGDPFNADLTLSGDASSTWGAQSFNSSNIYQLTALELNLRQFDGSGSFFVRIYDAGDSGLPREIIPGGAVTQQHPIAALGTNEDSTVLFSGLSIPLMPHSEYFVVVGREPGVANPSSELLWGYSSSGLQHSRYSQSRDQGVTWEASQSDAPQRMRLIGELNLPPVFSAQASNYRILESQTLTLTNQAIDPDPSGNPLVYALIAPPAGLAIDGSGVITWRPTADQSPSTNLIITTVSDGLATVTNELAIRVFSLAEAAANTPPQLFLPADVAINESDLYRLSLSASDGETATSGLTYELLSAPEGLTLSRTGELNWQPTELQGPNTYVIKITVTDDGILPMSVTNELVLRVDEVNQPPFSIALPPQLVSELQTLVFTNESLDADWPAQPLSYALVESPRGAQIDTNGVVSWTPDEEQGPSTNTMLIVVSDGVSRHTNSVQVVVSEVNRPPELYVPVDQTILPLTPLQLTAKAKDEDKPANRLTFSLLSPPQGMTINPANGQIDWLPSAEQRDSTNLILVTVADDGSPSLSDTQSFTVIVSSVRLPILLDNLQDPLYGDFCYPATNENIWAAQSFNSGPATYLTGLELNLFRSGQVSGTFFVTLCTAASPGVPGDVALGTLIATKQSISGLTTTVDGKWSIENVSIPIKTNTEYFVVVGMQGLSANALSLFDSKMFSRARTSQTNSWMDGVWTTSRAEGLHWGYSSLMTPGSGYNETLDAGRTWATADNVYPQRMKVKGSANLPPALILPASSVIVETKSYQGAVVATDLDTPAADLIYELLEAPTGLELNRTQGLLQWTPTEAQGPSTNRIVVRVTDRGIPPLSITNSFALTVLESNQAPALVLPANLSLYELTAFVGTATALDADLPTNRLMFSLITAPEGMTVDPVTGRLEWTPTELQGPSVQTVTVKVTDDGYPSQSATNSFTITVKEVNAAPILGPLSDVTVAESELFQTQVRATDADYPTNSLTYSLVSGPAGLGVSPTGSISWTPTESQVPSTNTVVLRVVDNGRPAMSATTVFTVIVSEKNTPPVLPLWAEQTIDELATLVVTNVAMDADVPAQALTYTLLQSPEGVMMDSHGVIRWTPTEAQGPSTNTIVTAVTDGLSSVTNQFVVIVNEVNQSPEWSALTNAVLHAGETLKLTLAATDQDLPRQTLAYELLSGPSGFTVSPSGDVTWTPADDQVGSSNVVVRVFDDATPSASATNQFQVEIVSRPLLQLSLGTNHTVQLSWNSIQGRRYRLESKEYLEEEAWAEEGEEIIATETRTAETLPMEVEYKCYRIKVIP